MLRSVTIENMAVIRRLGMEPDCGFTVLTGETGAGKSVIIDSLNFLLGKSPVRELVRTGEKSASVSALFSDIDGKTVGKLKEIGINDACDEMLFERVQNADGRTVCRICGRTVTRQMLRDAGSLLVSVHGQNDTGTVDEPGERAAMLDIIAGNGGLLEKYGEEYSAWTGVRQKISALMKSDAENARLRDMLEFQIKDITSAGLRSGEEEILLGERRRLQSMEKITKQTDSALRVIYRNDKGITASFLCDRAADALAKVSDTVPEYKALAERLRTCRYELDDIASEVLGISEGFDVLSGADAEKKLDSIESRLETISKLKRKYGNTVDEVIAFCEKAQAQLDETENSDKILKDLQTREKNLYADLSETAGKITGARRAAADAVKAQILTTLEYLDMPKVQFDITVEPLQTPGPDGADYVDFLLSANPGEPMQPLSKVASGGELSRVMLAMKCAVAGADGIPTVIFDEIDTGISGRTSRKVGLKLLEASKNSQVICVTHSAQIASLADTHLLISKHVNDGRTETSLRVLDYEGRVGETARILGGINVTEAQRNAAIDMIANREE